MGVRKYRSVSDLPPPPARRARDPENLVLAIALSDACRRLRPFRFPPGVYKNRTAEMAHQRQQQWARLLLRT